jgi:hypothetical protein
LQGLCDARIYQETFVGVYLEIFILSTQVACGTRFMMFVLTEWNACKGGLFDMLCVVWVGWTCMICHRLKTDAPYCNRLKTIDCLCDVYFRYSEWDSELIKLVVRSQFDCTTISDSRYEVSTY